MKPGQLLARVDDVGARDALVAARSGVTAARNALAVADTNAKRARTLAEAGAFAPQQAEQAESMLEGARAQLADARARLVSTEQQVSKARVRAPFAERHLRATGLGGRRRRAGRAAVHRHRSARLQFQASVPAAQVGRAGPACAWTSP